MVKSKGRGGAAYNPAIDPVRILFVCTGNICRSPLAEGFLRDRLERRGIPAEISSSGLSFTGRPATDEAVQVAAGRGVDISAHRSRVLVPEQLDVDIILAMERAHVREAVLHDRDAFARVFTLPEVVRLGRDYGPRHPSQTLAAWLKEVGASRRILDFAGSTSEDEVDDPYGQSLAFYEWCAGEIAALVDDLVALAWPDVEERGPDHAARAG